MARLLARIGIRSFLVALSAPPKKSPLGVRGQGARKALGLSGGELPTPEAIALRSLAVLDLLQCSIDAPYLYVNTRFGDKTL